ncbi:CLUMA_CG011661, isoform A [Clunio marinus]|uniref:CLUMA_CG011661, isoform A n=1 Tax=Clunio marinus TaxID=568069 RepID=A0A1J1IDK3_9DIPT|nr:CLUMA_CG011661, isoform A [Clunio marinus]
MDDTFMLILLVIVMLVGSYLAGSIPLVVSLSEAKLKIVSILGAGLLVGTALIVIIPEGVRSLYANGKTNEHSDTSTEESHHHHEPEDFSKTIGLSLVLGFVFMMLVDQISSRSNHSPESKDGKRNATATIGLVVHAAADGVALGAAAKTSHQDVEMIVFLAIMLHKAPAAFGLVSFLLHEGIERQRIRRHLGIFSMSAPLLTLITYFGIGQEQKETLNDVNATAVAMLFSAGTFLYVATVHVLPELTQQQHSHFHSSGPHYSHLEQGAGGAKPVSGLTNIELGTLISGALLPLLLTIGHHH